MTTNRSRQRPRLRRADATTEYFAGIQFGTLRARISTPVTGGTVRFWRCGLKNNEAGDPLVIFKDGGPVGKEEIGDNVRYPPTPTPKQFALIECRQ